MCSTAAASECVPWRRHSGKLAVPVPVSLFQVKLPNKELHQLEDLQRDLVKVLKRPGVQQQSIEVVLSKFTDGGAELLLTCLLLVAAASPDAQRLLLDLAYAVRNRGGTLVSIL